MKQTAFARELVPVKVPASTSATTEATRGQVSGARGLLGGGNWLGNGTRPDLSVMVSTGMQSLPGATACSIREINMLSRRSRQFADDGVTFKAIPLEVLAPMVHTDASLANAKGLRTQAGYFVSFTTPLLNQGKRTDISPLYWKSFKLRRVVGSTLGAECQAMREGLGHMLYFARMLAEALHPSEDPIVAIRRRGALAVTDCKSLYDAFTS